MGPTVAEKTVTRGVKECLKSPEQSPLLGAFSELPPSKQPGVATSTPPRQMPDKHGHEARL